MSIPELLAALESRIQAAAGGDPSGVLDEQALTEAAELLRQASAEGGGGVTPQVGHTLAWLHWMRFMELPDGEDDEALDAALEWFEVVHEADPQAVIPESIRPHLAGGTGNREAAHAALENLERAWQVDDPAALNQAIDLLTEVIDGTPPEHPDLRAMLSNLGMALLTRFERTDSTADLDAAVAASQRAVDSSPPGDPDLATMLSNLGLALQARFERIGGLADLDAAIAAGQWAISATPSGDPDLAGHLSNFSMALLTRFERTDRMSDLDAAVAAARQAVDVAPSGDTNFATMLSNLGLVLQARFRRTDSMADLDAAAAAIRQAVDATPPGHVSRGGFLSNLGMVLQIRFLRTDGRADLDAAITAIRQAVDVTPPGHPDLAGFLSNLGIALRTRFGRTGGTADLDAAIAAAQQAVDATPLDHPNRIMYSSNLSNALRVRFGRTGDVADLDAAVDAARLAVDATPLDHPNLAMYSTNLSNVLRVRFERVGAMADLDAAVAAGRQAVEVTLLDAPDSGGRLSNLSNALLSRFERNGDMADLDAAATAMRQAVDVTPPDHPDFAMYLSNLANTVRTRFDSTGAMADLDAAVAAGRRAVDATPLDHPQLAGRLSNLGLMLLARCDRTVSTADLDAAADAARTAVEVTPADHPDLAGYRSNLGLVLLTRAEHTGSLVDLDAAVITSQQAVDATSLDDPDLAKYLSNLGQALRDRSARTGGLTDLNAAVAAGRRAVEATPSDHPDLAGRLSNLGNALRTRFERTDSADDLREAARLWAAAAESAVAPADIRLRAAQVSAQATVELAGPAAALDVCRTAMALLPLLAWHGISDDDRRHRLHSDASSLARDAAACAIATGDLALAAEFLEQGRGVLWAQLLDGRTDLTDLEGAYPDLARQLRDCRAALDRPTRQALSAADSPQPGDPGRVTGDARHHAARRFDMLVAQVRALAPTAAFAHPDRFLRPPQAGALLPGEGDGPVVIVNISRWRCDALIFEHTGITSVELPDLTEDGTIDAANLYLQALQNLVQGSGSKDVVPSRPAEPAGETAVSSTLEWLWDRITGPVLDHLGHTAVPRAEQWPRVWWCPTGPLTMLPLHAAGHHTDDSGLTVYDRVVSSYTPTLRALSHARRPSTTATSEGGLLVIAMPETPGHGRLPGADEERRTLAGLLDGARRTELVDHLATRTAIITELPRHQWLHASCHGTQDLAAPAEGGLVPYDWQTAGLVGIGDLTDTAQVGGEFAFLSACKTATGGVANLDEAISIATAMQYAGWRHVIGTQWAVGDQIAVTVTDGVYPQLVRHGELDPTRAAQALHHTIRGLREQQPDRPSVWVPFIHIGP